MTRSAGSAFTLACSIVGFWLSSRISLDAATGVDALTVGNVTAATQLTLFAAFITAALITHFQPGDMSRGRRVARRAGAIVLAISAAALDPQIAVIAAAGYVVFVLASDVRRRRRARLDLPD